MSKSKKAKKPIPDTTVLPKKEKRRFPIPYRHLIAVGLILGVALVAYSNSFYAPFHFDDLPNITMNPNVQIKALTWERIGKLVSVTYKDTIRVFSYITLALNYYYGGEDVFGYHLVNFIIHVLSGILLYWFLLLTFNLPSLKEKYGAVSYRTALFASLIFIAHPVQTQAVTYIVQRMASMACLFYLLSFVLYIKGRLSSGRKRVAYFGGMAIAYLFGVFSKENTAILPLFIAIYEFYFFQKLELSEKRKKALLTLLGILIVLGAIGIIIWGKRYFDLTIVGYQTRSFTMTERVLTQFRVVLHYLSLLIYPNPSRLNLDYDFPVSKTIFAPPTTLISIVVVVGLIVYSIWTAKKRPVLSFCILWYFGNLVIESSIFPLEMVFEHRLYLPAIGPFILFSLLVVRVIEKIRNRDWGAGRVKTGPLEDSLEVETVSQ